VVSDTLTRKYSGGYTVVPAWLVGRLALDSPMRGLGLGKHLLLDAIENIVKLSQAAGGRLIVVDPIDEVAAQWYSRRGFVSFDQSTNGKPSRYYLSVADAEKTLALKTATP